jgi:hypothetical protein
LDARLTTSLFKKNIVAKSKEMKTGWSIDNLAESTKESYGSKRAALPMMIIYDYVLLETHFNITFWDVTPCSLIDHY